MTTLGVATQITSVTPMAARGPPPPQRPALPPPPAAEPGSARPGPESGLGPRQAAWPLGLEADQGTSLGPSGKVIVEEIPDARRPVTVVRGTLARRDCVDPLLRSERRLRAARHRRFSHLGCNKPHFPHAMTLCAPPHPRRPAPRAAGPVRARGTCSRRSEASGAARAR